MSTSPRTSTWLQKPEGDAKISQGTFGYINARIRQRAYDLVVREFKKSGLTQAQLCRRWGKSADLVSRFLARPGNWELNTFTEALFAISGAVPMFSAAYPTEKSAVQIKSVTESAAEPIQIRTTSESRFDIHEMIGVTEKFEYVERRVA